MIEHILGYLSVYLTSTVKFVLAPFVGMGYQLSVVESAIFTILGMMTTVIVVSIAGEPLRKWVSKRRQKRGRKLFTKRNRLIVKVWNNYGMFGVAFLTPILLSPVAGAIIAVSFGGSRMRMYKWMFVSAVFWAFTQSFIFLQFGNLIFK